MQRLKCDKQAMLDHVRDSDQRYEVLYRQFQDVHGEWCAAETEKSCLQEQVSALRALQVGTTASSVCLVYLMEGSHIAENARWLRCLPGDALTTNTC